MIVADHPDGRPLPDCPPGNSSGNDAACGQDASLLPSGGVDRRDGRSRHIVATPALLMLFALVVAGLTWCIGFAWFVQLTAIVPPPPPHADGIVVLTGGAERVETGLRLLLSGRGDKLLVSGVAHGSELAALARVAGLDAAPVAERITLGHDAVSTRGNAAETRAWVEREGVRTLIVVTSYYHMPRALAELDRAMPDVTLYPVPVTPTALRERTTATGLRLLLDEYVKYIAVRTGLSRLVTETARA